MRLLLALLILALVPVRTAAEDLPTLEEALQQHSVIRLHVIAHSDGAEDQAVKLIVRDALVERLAPQLAQVPAEEIGQTILTLLPMLSDCAEAAALSAGYSRPISVSYGCESFPDRQYDGTLLPAGEYDALCVRLGSAQGRNWWCVMYPPLCLLAPDLADAAQAARPTAQSPSGTVLQDQSQPVVFESAILRWIRSLPFFSHQEASTCVNESAN